MKDKVETLYELHEASVTRMNELEFMKDEQSFLEHLLSSHFLELSAPDLYETTRKLIKKLKEVEHLGGNLMTEVQLFNKQIAHSLDDKKSNIELNRKMLAQLAVLDTPTFNELINVSK